MDYEQQEQMGSRTWYIFSGWLGLMALAGWADYFGLISDGSFSPFLTSAVTAGSVYCLVRGRVRDQEEEQEFQRRFGKDRDDL